MNNATRMFREASAFEAKSIEFMDVCLGVAREAGLFVTQVETKCVNACEFQFEAVLSDNVRLWKRFTRSSRATSDRCGRSACRSRRK
jgi:hypothetical protein